MDETSQVTYYIYVILIIPKGRLEVVYAPT